MAQDKKDKVYYPAGIDPLWDNANLFNDISEKKWKDYKMTDLEQICDDPKCNCKNVEPSFRAWYHEERPTTMKYTTYKKPTELQKEYITCVDVMAFNLLSAIETAKSDPRMKALAKTKLEECIMWINKGIYNNGEGE